AAFDLLHQARTRDPRFVRDQEARAPCVRRVRATGAGKCQSVVRPCQGGRRAQNQGHGYRRRTHCDRSRRPTTNARQRAARRARHRPAADLFATGRGRAACTAAARRAASVIPRPERVPAAADALLLRRVSMAALSGADLLPYATATLLRRLRATPI